GAVRPDVLRRPAQGKPFGVRRGHHPGLAREPGGRLTATAPHIDLRAAHSRDVESVAYVTTTFPTFAWFIESEVLRLHERGVRVRVLTLRKIGAPLHPEHADLIPLTSAVGSPVAAAAWRALGRWMLRRPGTMLKEAARMVWASKLDPYALAGHIGYLPAAARV